MMPQPSSQNKGSTLIYLLIVIFLFTTVAVPLIGSMATRIRAVATTAEREEALQIAEAGVNYYQWRLAHYPTDYKDGTTGSGPYVHDYVDLDTGQIIGQYSLTITPPLIGSTIVTIRSTGWTTKNPNIKRTVTAKYGIPSLAQYSFLSNDIIWIGAGETVHGLMQSNNGIRFDGTGNAPIQSAKSTYTCPANQGSPCPRVQNGVWGNATQAVKNFWQFPVPAVDFSSVTSNFATLKSTAQAPGGIYLPPSSARGYSLVFKNNGTVDIYKVTTLRTNPSGWDVNGTAHNEGVDYNARTFLYNKTLPTSGIIYIEDKIWVEGTLRGRVLVAAAILPYNISTAPTIYIPNNIVYSAKDGSDVLGLLAQNNVVVTYRAPTNLEINGALIAQTGSAQFFYYPGTVKNSILVYGSIMTFGQWTWTWVDAGGSVLSGYTSTTNIYDNNLLYSPPPGFPLSSSGYQQLSWTSD